MRDDSAIEAPDVVEDFVREAFEESARFFCGPRGFWSLRWEHEDAKLKEVVENLNNFCLSFFWLSQVEHLEYGDNLMEEIRSMFIRVDAGVESASNTEIRAFIQKNIWSRIGWSGI